MVNTVPFRLEVQKRIQQLLGSISPTNGYSKTITEDMIFRGRRVFGESDPLPMLVILEVPLPVDQLPTPPGTEGRLQLWDLMIQGFMEDDYKNPTDIAYYYVADVIKALATHRHDNQNYPKFGFGSTANTVEDIFIGDEKVTPADEISAKAYFWLPITLKIVENLAKPMEYRSL